MAQASFTKPETPYWSGRLPIRLLKYIITSIVLPGAQSGTVGYGRYGSGRKSLSLSSLPTRDVRYALRSALASYAMLPNSIIITMGERRNIREVRLQFASR
jgi:hypothetical protein